MAIMTRLIGINNSPTLMVPSNSISSSSRVNILLPKQRSHYSTTTTNCLCVKSHDSTSNSLSQSSDQLISTVDQKLLKVLKSEIKSSEKHCLSECTVPSTSAPPDFPFIIEHSSFGTLIELERESFPGERISVSVISNYERKFWISIHKQDGSDMRIELIIYGSTDDHEIIVQRIDIDLALDRLHDGRDQGYIGYHAPEFKELARDDDVHSSVKEFIGIRGINTTNLDFLLNYTAQHRKFKTYDSYKRKTHFLKLVEKFVLN